MRRSNRFERRRSLVPAWLAAVAVLGGPGLARAAFVEQAAAFGIDNGDSMSFAAGFIDFDGDGDVDFYANNHWKSVANFYRNEGGTSFLEISGHFPLDNNDRHDQLWGDFDNDGDPDQYICHGRTQPNELYWNLGCSILADGAVDAGVDDSDGRGREITLADFNNDGFLDIYTVNDFRFGFPKPSRLYWNNGDRTFTAHPHQGPDSLLFRSRLHCSSADYDLDGNVDIITTNPPFVLGELWKGNGDSTWTDVTTFAFAGIDSPFVEAQGLAWGDYDYDGDLDLMTVSGNRGVWDYAAIEGDSLRYYAECDSGVHKTVTFTTDGDSVTVDLIAADYHVTKTWCGASGDSVDSYPSTFALDKLVGEPPQKAAGRQGAFLWTSATLDTVSFCIGGDGEEGEGVMLGGSLRVGAGTILGMSDDYAAPPLYADHDLHDWRNRLYRNDGTTFTEVTATAFAENDSTYNSKTASWGDYDNDGLIDLYVVNGGTVETGNEPNYLYRNNGDGTFTDVAALEGVTGATRGSGDGACWGDVDGDGFLDLFVDNGGEHPPIGVGPRELYMNMANGNHWIAFHLRGLASNGSGIGARVRISSATAGVQWRHLLGESDNGFMNAFEMHFGLGQDAVVDTIEVHWPSGLVDKFFDKPADRRWWALEGKPLREAVNPHFIANRNNIFANITVPEIKNFNVPLDNFGGLSSHYVARYEMCGPGTPVTWAWIAPESTTVFPGGDANPAVLSIDSSRLTEGTFCVAVIFESNSFMGPDTLKAFLEVSDPVTGVDPIPLVPDEFALGLPWPNPGRTGLEIGLALPEPGFASVDVYDVAGRHVATLQSAFLPAGLYTLSWDRRDRSGRRAVPGIYLIRAVAGGERATRKAVLLD